MIRKEDQSVAVVGATYLQGILSCPPAWCTQDSIHIGPCFQEKAQIYGDGGQTARELYIKKIFCNIKNKKKTKQDAMWM